MRTIAVKHYEKLQGGMFFLQQVYSIYGSLPITALLKIWHVCSSFRQI